jgi:hypothetical protein
MKNAELNGVYILVEIHSEFGDKREIIRRFLQTHNITEISPSVRAVSDIRVRLNIATWRGGANNEKMSVFSRLTLLI